MPFGLKNAPETFQLALDLILAGYRWQSSIVYIDDVIVFSQSFEEHLEHVRDIFKALSAAGVTLKPSKCNLLAQTVDYFGHKVSPGRLEVAIKNTKVMKKCLYPSMQSHLRSFLGLCNVYRRFMPNFARTAAPHNDLLKKCCTKELPPPTDEQIEAFEKLRQALISAPIFKPTDLKKPYSVDTDACDHQVGAGTQVLSGMTTALVSALWPIHGNRCMNTPKGTCSKATYHNQRRFRAIRSDGDRQRDHTQHFKGVIRCASQANHFATRVDIRECQWRARSCTGVHHGQQISSIMFSCSNLCVNLVIVSTQLTNRVGAISLQRSFFR